MKTLQITAEETLQHHLQAFGNNDLDEIMKDYSEELVLVVCLFLFVLAPTGIKCPKKTWIEPANYHLGGSVRIFVDN